MTQNKIVWMDIPVENLERASQFYSNLMDLKFIIEEFGDMKFALYPHSDNESAFCLVVEKSVKPCGLDYTTPLIYLNVNGRIDLALNEVTKNDGKIITTKEQIGPYGFRAIILDSEGNRIALHSMS